MRGTGGGGPPVFDLPVAMRYRHLAKNARAAVGVYASNIHGIRALLQAGDLVGEMVIEYAGEEYERLTIDSGEILR